VLQPGFWLSFGAVATILYATVGRPAPLAAGLSRRARWVQRLRGATRIQYAVTLGLVPLTMLLFAQVSLVSPLANAIAIPLVSFFVTPAALLGSVLPMPLAEWVLGAAHWLVWMLARLLHWMSAFPAAVWNAPVPPWWTVAVALAGAAWLLAPRGWPLRWLGVACLLPVLLTSAAAPKPGEMWVTALDVGQGMALLVETPNRRLLYDTGPAYSPESDGGNRVILPYLKARGINKLDAVIVSHSDTDHAGGALSIFEDIPVGWTASSVPYAHPVARRGPGHRRCQAGQSWEWDGVRFEMLYPVPAVYESTKWKANARSCTLKVSVGERAILLPGDIEAVQEGHLLASGPALLRANVLLAPHHGSGTSSTLSFLQAVQPEIALFQVGHANRYRHPKQEVYQRYGELGVLRLRTDESGAVSLRFGEQLEVRAYRVERPRYWYGR
jgi:competence protein ComEC